MKKILLFIVMCVGALLLGSAVGYKLHERYIYTKVEKMNARITELINIGYTPEASRKIGATEAGFIPLDDEYFSLIED